MTGIVTGLEEYIRANAPMAINMPFLDYDLYFAGPWATATEHEAKHRELTRSIGESIRGKSGRSIQVKYVGFKGIGISIVLGH